MHTFSQLGGQQDETATQNQLQSTYNIIHTACTACAVLRNAKPDNLSPPRINGHQQTTPSSQTTRKVALGQRGTSDQQSNEKHTEMGTQNEHNTPP